MKKSAIGIAAAGLAALSMSATAWWGPGYDRYYGGYAPYYAYAPYGFAANLTEEQIEAQKQAIESQQKAALEHFQRMEEQRKAVTAEQIKQMQAQREAVQKAMEEYRKAMPGSMADAPIAMYDPMMHDPMMHDPMMHDPMMHDPMGDAIFKQMQAEREAMQKAVEERRKTIPGRMADAPFAMHDPMMHDPMGDARFKQMQAEREAMLKAMEERRTTIPAPLMDTPFARPAPMNEEYFKQIEEQRLAMQESMEAQRKAMEKFHEERLKNVRPDWTAPYGPTR